MKKHRYSIALVASAFFIGAGAWPLTITCFAAAYMVGTSIPTGGNETKP